MDTYTSLGRTVMVNKFIFIRFSISPPEFQGGDYRQLRRQRRMYGRIMEYEQTFWIS